MIDYTASTIARLEYEERVRSLAPVHDYDAWTAPTAEDRQALSVEALLSSLRQGLVQVSIILKLKPDVPQDSQLVAQEPSNVPG